MFLHMGRIYTCGEYKLVFPAHVPFRLAMSPDAKSFFTSEALMVRQKRMPSVSTTPITESGALSIA